MSGSISASVSEARSTAGLMGSAGAVLDVFVWTEGGRPGPNHRALKRRLADFGPVLFLRFVDEQARDGPRSRVEHWQVELDSAFSALEAFGKWHQGLVSQSFRVGDSRAAFAIPLDTENGHLRDALRLLMGRMDSMLDDDLNEMPRQLRPVRPEPVRPSVRPSARPQESGSGQSVQPWAMSATGGCLDVSRSTELSRSSEAVQSRPRARPDRRVRPRPACPVRLIFHPLRGQETTAWEVLRLFSRCGIILSVDFAPSVAQLDGEAAWIVAFEDVDEAIKVFDNVWGLRHVFDLGDGTRGRVIVPLDCPSRRLLAIRQYFVEREHWTGRDWAGEEERCRRRWEEARRRGRGAPRHALHRDRQPSPRRPPTKRPPPTNRQRSVSPVRRVKVVKREVVSLVRASPAADAYRRVVVKLDD